MIAVVAQAWCPPDGELARADIGWSTLTGRKVRNGPNQLSQAEIEVIKRVVTRAEAFEREEQARIRKLWSAVPKATGDGILQCVACGAILSANATAGSYDCPRCEKRVGICCTVGKLCRRCYAMQEVWLKSGAWLTNGDVKWPQIEECSSSLCSEVASPPELFQGIRRPSCSDQGSLVNSSQSVATKTGLQAPVATKTGLQGDTVAQLGDLGQGRPGYIGMVAGEHQCLPEVITPNQHCSHPERDGDQGIAGADVPTDSVDLLGRPRAASSGAPVGFMWRRSNARRRFQRPHLPNSLMESSSGPQSASVSPALSSGEEEEEGALERTGEEGALERTGEEGALQKTEAIEEAGVSERLDVTCNEQGFSSTSAPSDASHMVDTTDQLLSATPTLAQTSGAPPTLAQPPGAPPTLAQPSSAPSTPIQHFNRRKDKRVVYSQSMPRFILNSDVPDDGLFGSIELTVEYLPAAMQLVVTVLRCKGLCSVHSKGLSDPYVILRLIPDSKSMQRFETETIYQCLNPEFNQSFTFTDMTQQLMDYTSLGVVVMNKDTSSSDDLLGACKVGMWEAIPNKVVSLRKILDQGSSVPDAIYQGTQEGGVASKGEVACSFSYSTDKEILTVNITEATYNLPAGSAGPANCYVKCYLDDGELKQKQKTRVIQSSLHLAFNESESLLFQVSFYKLTHCTLSIQVWTARHRLVPNVCIGGTELKTMLLWRQWLKDKRQTISGTYKLQ